MENKKLNEWLVDMQLNASEEAFENVYKECRKGVFSFVYSYMKNYHDAEDIMQQTFMTVRMKVDAYVAGTNAVSWVLEIAKNLCLNEIKKRKREVVFSDAENEVQKLESTFKESGWFVLDAIDKHLDDDEKKIIMLHLVSELKHREIAELIKMPLGTVLWKYNKAINTLKSKLGDNNEN